MSKVERFQTFFSNRLKEIPHMDSPVPGHLFGITEKETTELKDCFVRAKEARNRLRKLAGDTLLRISRSEDDVSLRLSGLFDSAISPSTEEMQRARERKEKGNPPGKARDPLGDQITWEQFLTHCQQRKIERAWIITSDEDYYTKADKACLLNPLLARDLSEVGSGVEIRCFHNLGKGVQDFATNSGVKAKNLPTEAEAAEIEKEIEALPPMDWLNVDDATITLLRNQLIRSFIAATSTSLGSSPTVLTSSPTEKKTED